jgi:hypothetical protein
MQKYLVAVFLLLCGVTALHAAQAQVPAATEAPPPGQQPTVSTMNLADKCLEQSTDCMAKVSSKIDSHEITTKAQFDTESEACFASVKLCLDATHAACLHFLKNDMANLCLDYIPKAPEPVVQDDCNVVPSSAQAGKALQSYMKSGSALPDGVLKMQQVQKNAFDLEIKCEQLKAARTPCK